MYGINVDATAIARGLLEILRDGGHDAELNAIRFGMSPAVLMRSLERQLGEKFDAIGYAAVGTAEREIQVFNESVSLLTRDPTPAIQVDKAKRSAFVQETVAKVHCELLRLGGCVV